LYTRLGRRIKRERRHADIRTTEVYFVRREDAEVAARRIQIPGTGRKGE
jgi:hypothetical protein